MPYERSLLIEQRFQSVINLMETRTVNTQQLAIELGVSVATVQRIVAALKQRGYVIRSVHESEGWRYEIVGKPQSKIEGA